MAKKKTAKKTITAVNDNNCSMSSCAIDACGKLLCYANCLMSVLVLTMRLWIANIFWKSGVQKLANWENTVALFKQEYKVPVLPPECAAYLGTGVELIASLMLVVGLGSRLGALALLGMAIVIDLTYMHYEVHYYWMFLLGTILLYGPGKISLDHMIVRKYCPIRGDKACTMPKK